MNGDDIKATKQRCTNMINLSKDFEELEKLSNSVFLLVRDHVDIIMGSEPKDQDDCDKQCEPIGLRQKMGFHLDRIRANLRGIQEQAERL